MTSLCGGYVVVDERIDFCQPVIAVTDTLEDARCIQRCHPGSRVMTMERFLEEV